MTNKSTKPFPPQLVCPTCHNNLTRSTKYLTCKKCKEIFPIVNGIPILIPKKALRNNVLQESKIGYEFAYTKTGIKLEDGSYEILAAIAKGNLTLDIACGEGWIAKLAPNTVCTDFSVNALKKAKKNGAKYLTCCCAEFLPYPDNSFDIAICNGSLEHFTDPQKAVLEMARVSHIQVNIIHRELPFPFARTIRKIASKFLMINQQPIETPFYWHEVKSLYRNANLKMIYYGLWSYPTNLRLAFPFLPESLNPPSAYFIISVKRRLGK